MNSLGLYRHIRIDAILGRNKTTQYNHSVEYEDNKVPFYLEDDLRKLGWIKVAPVVLAGWCDD